LLSCDAVASAGTWRHKPLVAHMALGASAIAMPNTFMRALGPVPLIPAVPLNPSNRRIRTRMYGGVGGVES
jgi:hypothetical protein